MISALCQIVCQKRRISVTQMGHFEEQALAATLTRNLLQHQQDVLANAVLLRSVFRFLKVIIATLIGH